MNAATVSVLITALLGLGACNKSEPPVTPADTPPGATTPSGAYDTGTGTASSAGVDSGVTTSPPGAYDGSGATSSMSSVP